jgi:NADPH:quinone reductase-like Zn-dependent oxidoreductase
MKAFALVAENQPAALTELPEPTTGTRIRVRAASVNGMDVYEASGALMGMMPHELPTIIGRDFAGTVESVEGAQGEYAVGDEVLGFIPSMPPLHAGTWAESIAGEDAVLARVPAGLSLEVAAAIPLAGVTALDAVEAIDVSAGDVVVVAGATGGVGSMAVQLASQRGARVIATARPGDEEEFVRELGASDVVDYSSGDVAGAIRALAPEGVTALIDTVNRDAAFTSMVDLLGEGGRVATTLGAADVEGLAARGVRGTNLMATPTPEKLANLAEQVAAGTLKVAIQQTLPLDRADTAIRAFQGGTLGKLVLTMR